MNTPLSSRTAGFALLGGVVIAAVGLSAAGTPAFAAPGHGGTGSITVHKLEQPDGPIGPNDGSRIDTAGAEPLVAGFTACAIDGVDLSVAADWDRLGGLRITQNGTARPVVSEDGAELGLDCGAEQTTDASNGATEFADLVADRAYAVYESTAPANALHASQPTIVTVPYPGAGGGDEWNYHPHLYPKNALAGSGASKTGEIVGGAVEFDITVPINPLGDGEIYSQLRIDDELAAELQYTGGDVALRGASGAPVRLSEGDDYSLTAPKTGAPGQTVTLDFQGPAGLDKINANSGGEIVPSIRADAIGSGSTANEARITVNGAATAPGTGPAVANPEKFFSGAHIVKMAKNRGASRNVPLAGAKFDVYTAADAATDCPATPAPRETRVLAGQISGDDGSTSEQVLAAGRYCVYEVGVPSGYKGLRGGVLLSVAGENDSVTVVNTQMGADEGDLPALPVTGAQGSVLLIASGAALLAVGLVLLVVRRRNRARQ